MVGRPKQLETISAINVVCCVGRVEILPIQKARSDVSSVDPKD